MHCTQVSKGLITKRSLKAPPQNRYHDASNADPHVANDVQLVPEEGADGCFTGLGEHRGSEISYTWAGRFEKFPVKANLGNVTGWKEQAHFGPIHITSGILLGFLFLFFTETLSGLELKI